MRKYAVVRFACFSFSQLGVSVSESMLESLEEKMAWAELYQHGE